MESDKNEGQMLALIMEEGICHAFMVSRSTTKLKFKIEKAISKRKAFANKTEK